MTALIPAVAGTTFATIFSAGLLAMPAVLAVRRLLARRVLAPSARDAVERNLVLASSLAGAVGAVAWSDATAALMDGGIEAAGLLLCFVAPAPLAAVPWVAGELLSGASARRWLALAATATAALIPSWAAWAFCFRPGDVPFRFSPDLGVMQLAAGVFSGLCAAQTYLAVRGEPLETLPPQAVVLQRL